MFQKNSRYRGLPDRIGTDPRGRGILTKELRPLPDMAGELQHAVQDIDRLDHLAYKYYRESRKWWRICDANPDYPLPLSLLGQDAMVTEKFPLQGGQADNRAQLLAGLRARAGVADVAWEEGWEIVQVTVLEAGQPVEIASERARIRLVIRYNRFATDRFALMDAIEAQGFDRVPPEPVGRVGKPIIIPRDGGS